jgi:HSP20 family protein
MPHDDLTAQAGERHEDPLGRLLSMTGMSRLLPAFQSVLGERHHLPGLGERQLPVEEFRDENTRVIRVELPGIDPENDVELTISDATLTIHAERREEKQTRERGHYRSEFHYGSISKSVPLPPGTSQADVKATYKAGILEVRIPVAAEEQRPTEMRIPVRAG